MAEILGKAQVLFLAVKKWRGASIAGVTDGTVEEFNRIYGAGLHSWGIPLENDEDHDEKVRSAVNRLKFDIICFGGGVRKTDEAWADRIAGFIDDSMNKNAKIVYPTAAQEAAPLVLEAAWELGIQTEA